MKKRRRMRKKPRREEGKPYRANGTGKRLPCKGASMVAVLQS